MPDTNTYPFSRPLTHSSNGRFFIKGFHSRFTGDMSYIVYDTLLLTPDEVHQGKGYSVYTSDNVEDAVLWMESKHIVELIEPHESNYEGWPELRKSYDYWAARKGPAKSL